MFRFIFVVSAHLCALVASATLRGASMAEVQEVREDIAKCLPLIASGGAQARIGLLHLLSLSDEPSAVEVMKGAGVEASVARLMKSPNTSERTQGLAGSLITRLNNMPVAVEISDEASGSEGRVHVTFPRPSRVYEADKVALQLAAGVSPNQIN